MRTLLDDRFEALERAIRTAGIPIDGMALLNVTTTPPTVRVDYTAAATAQQRANAASIVAAFDWSQTAQNTTNVQSTRSAAIALLASPEGTSKLLRAVAEVVRKRLNLIQAAIPRGILSITRSGTVGTVVTRDPHGLTTGDTVRIQGTTLAAYNITAVVTVTNTTTFTYPGVAGNPVSPAVGTTIMFTLGVVPSMAPLTLLQIRTALEAEIAAGTVDT